MLRVMNANEAADFINHHVTYKPDYRLEAMGSCERSTEYLTLRLTFVGKNSRKHNQLRTLSFQHAYLWWLDFGPEFLLKTVQVFVHEWETHEADEWLKVDGEMVKDPHG